MTPHCCSYLLPDKCLYSGLRAINWLCCSTKPFDKEVESIPRTHGFMNGNISLLSSTSSASPLPIIQRARSAPPFYLVSIITSTILSGFRSGLVHCKEILYGGGEIFITAVFDANQAYNLRL